MPDAPLVPFPAQTIGPFFGFALVHAGGNELVDEGAPGEIRLHGRVLDGRGDPIPDALLELWQPDPEGRIVDGSHSGGRGHGFTGFGRAETDASGKYWFRTVEPGASGPGKAAFFAVAVFARGLQDRLFTRAYLPSPEAEDDPLLASLPDERRSTLMVVREGGGSLRFDLRLQGEGETVFLSFPRRDGGAYP